MVGKHRLCKDRRWSWDSLEKAAARSNFWAVHMALIGFISFRFDFRFWSVFFLIFFSNILIVWIEHFEPLFSVIGYHL